MSPACLHAVVAIVRDEQLAVVHRSARRLSELALAAPLVTEAEAPRQVCSERDDAVVVPVVEWHARVFSFLPTGLQVCEARFAAWPTRLSHTYSTPRETHRPIRLWNSHSLCPYEPTLPIGRPSVRRNFCGGEGRRNENMVEAAST